MRSQFHLANEELANTKSVVEECMKEKYYQLSISMLWLNKHGTARWLDDFLTLSAQVGIRDIWGRRYLI
ncbi:unnamed protein product [Hydatigera taeniaeformis]|uniref:Uncharacterized protein n=1 Tax=Hydatigena taeniaeformis TaxID=6205 RepID=A0A0R3WKH1_HYDTA|nr:unnamed protein product [Hydatigera taeniaeformis]